MLGTGEENRNITRTASIIIFVFIAGAFAGVWLLFYNNIVFRSHREQGAMCTFIIWMILYLKFGQIYRAFKIASNAIGEIVFSQFLSIGFADLIIYIAGCLVARKYINVLPGIVTVTIQIAISAIWATLAKQYFLRNVEPQKCLLIYDSDMPDIERIRGKEFAAKLERTYGHLFEIVKCVPIKNNLQDVYTEIANYPVIFIYDMRLEKRCEIINYCVNAGKRFFITPTIEDVLARGYEVKHFIDTPLLAYNGSIKSNQTYLGKRTLDIVFSLLLIILTTPIMLLTAIAIKLDDRGGSILFKQERIGQSGKVFKILKFRSMIMDAEKDGKPRPCVAGDSRVTKVGKVIRATRIDELPQLFNILKGDLSLVGPRPERVEHVDLYTQELPEFSYRLRVKAGLTGYAQIYGKYNTSARDKLLLDLLYIERQSFLMDMRIVFLTVKIMFTPESTEGFEESRSKAINIKSDEHKSLYRNEYLRETKI